MAMNSHQIRYYDEEAKGVEGMVLVQIVLTYHILSCLKQEMLPFLAFFEDNKTTELMVGGKQE